MRRALLLIGMTFLLAVVLTAQQTAVQSPNGGETWKKGEFRQIKFSCDLTSGQATLLLVRMTTPALGTQPSRTAVQTNYQELGQIGTVRLYPNTPSYSFNWEVGRLTNGAANPGSGHKILVKIATPSTTISDVSDVPFAIGAPPTIDMFAINDGLAVTEQRRVTLNYRFSGFPVPTKYRVRHPQSTGTLETMSSWLPLPTGSWPVYELPDKTGDYSIGLILANDLGESPIVGDMIRYAPAVPLKDYTVPAASIACNGFPDLNPAWYSCRCTAYSVVKPSANDCSCNSAGAIIVRTTAAGIPGANLGTKVEYEFFGGRQLNPGWSFVSISYSDAACKDSAGSAVLIMPQAGSRTILFKVRLWTEALGNLPASCEFRINSLVIRGPADRPVSEAFK
jgi:hypothetical protein